MTTTINWNGIHHIALVTPDLDATIAFYGDILGMQIGKIFPATADRGRHCFIKPGDNDTWGIHFFEYPDAEIFGAAVALQDRFAFLRGALQHIAFALPDESTGNALLERLEAHTIANTGINDLGSLRNIMFLDNNGVMLEAAWSK